MSGRRAWAEPLASSVSPSQPDVDQAEVTKAALRTAMAISARMGAAGEEGELRARAEEAEAEAARLVNFSPSTASVQRAGRVLATGERV
eukprot:938865-Rhodomonas_salina.2